MSKNNKVLVIGLSSLVLGIVIGTGIAIGLNTNAQSSVNNNSSSISSQSQIQNSFSMKMGNFQNREAVRSSIENNDYNAFLEAIKDLPAEDIIKSKINSEESFKKLVEAHNARKSGDIVTFKSIMEELGINKHIGKGMGMKMRGNI